MPDPRIATARACPPTAQHAVRQGPVVARNIAAELGVGDAPAPFTYKAQGLVREPRPLQGGRQARPAAVPRLLAWWMARTYHMSQIPGMARKIRAVVDWTVGLPFGRDVAEVGSIGHPRPLRDEVYARGGTHRPVE